MKKQYPILFLLLPALLFLWPPFMGKEPVKIWGKEIEFSGYISCAFLCLSLVLSPLNILFPRVLLFKSLNHHRRAIGLAVFGYAFFHCVAFLVKVYLKKGTLFVLRAFLHPVILPGLLGFLLLIPLAATSNNWSIRKLGGSTWKKLHRLVYITEGLIFLHLLFQGGAPLVISLTAFPILFALQRFRWKRRAC